MRASLNAVAAAIVSVISVCMWAGEVKPLPTGQSVGVVLSGGGAKGIAHIGAIQALEDNGIPIDYVAGTSMGAIVSGLYACGYTPAEMMDLIASREFSYWSTGQIDPELTYYFLQKPMTPSFADVNINLSRNDSTNRAPGLMPSSLISPLPMNFGFMELFSGYTAQCGGNFDNLFVPFRCVTSDIAEKRKIVLRSGELSHAIRASMTFPCVFAPIQIDSTYVYDGGLYDNFPVDVMRSDFAPDIMIGFDVHSTAPESDPTNIINTIENMAIVAQDYSIPADEGIYVHFDVSKFGLLDWGKARELYQIGYDHTMQMIDSIKTRVTSRISPETRRLRREVFKSSSPYLRFDSVSVRGGTRAQDEYLTHLFQYNDADTFGIQHARLSYYRALSPGRLSNLMPVAHYDATDGLFTLDLDATYKNNFGIGAGGYLTSSSNSFIFLSADYSSMSFRSTEARLMGWIGQSYMAGQLQGRIFLNRRRPMAFGVEAVVSRQKYYESDKLFYDDSSPTFITHHDGFGRLNFGWAVGRKGLIRVSAGGGRQEDKFYASDAGDFRASGNVRTWMSLGQAAAVFEYNTLNNRNFASSGTFFNVTAMQVLGKYNYCEKEYDAPVIEYDKGQHWMQAEGTFEHYVPLGRHFTLGTSGDVLFSTRKLLNTYYASLVNAPDFSPTASTAAIFNKAFRANSFVAVGLTPIWHPIQNAQVRLSANLFLPFRRIERAADGVGAVYGGWFRNPGFIGELNLVYNLPFASVSGYLNYLTYPARNWNVGLSFGLFFRAKRFLR